MQCHKTATQGHNATNMTTTFGSKTPPCLNFEIVCKIHHLCGCKILHPINGWKCWELFSFWEFWWILEWEEVVKHEEKSQFDRFFHNIIHCVGCIILPTKIQ